MIYCEEQLTFLLWLKEWRGPFLDPLFLFLSYLDTGYFYLGIVAATWLGFSRKWGIRALYLVSFSLMMTKGAKLFFSLPRPCDLVDHLCFFKLSSYGFPSGGAQNGIVVGGLMILYWKHRLARPLGIAYFVLMSLSRMYLGVHFPVDVLGGWVLGLLSLTIFYHMVEPIEAFAQKNLSLVTALSIALPLLFWALSPHSPLIFGIEALAGGGIGIFLSRSFKQIPDPPRGVQIALLRALFGLASTFALFILTNSPFLTYLWISWLGSLPYTATD